MDSPNPAAVLAKAMRDLSETALPIVLPLTGVERLVAVAELAPPVLVEREEASAIAFARAQVGQVRLLLQDGKPSGRQRLNRTGPSAR